MSNPSPKPSRKRQPTHVETVTDPAEITAAEEWSRQYRKTAMGQIGCWNVVDAPLPLLAQVIAELPKDDQQEFLKELVERVPVDALQMLDENMKERMGRGAA
jgi:hypothetical protein